MCGLGSDLELFSRIGHSEAAMLQSAGDCWAVSLHPLIHNVLAVVKTRSGSKHLPILGWGVPCTTNSIVNFPQDPILLSEASMCGWIEDASPNSKTSRL